MPYNDYLIKTSQTMLGSSKAKQDTASTLPKVELDFKNIETKVFCFDLQVEFTFSDDTLQSLTKTLAGFPTIIRQKQMPTIKFGHTVNNVSLYNLANLLRVCKNKVNIDLKGTDLKRII